MNFENWLQKMLITGLKKIGFEGGYELEDWLEAEQ